MQNHYFDTAHALHPYTHSAYTTPNTVAPINALRGTLPKIPEGCWLGEKNGEFVQIENHKGKSGYVNGEPYEIKEYGPLPDGWSDTLPPPTTEELMSSLRSQRNAKLNATDKYLLADFPISPEKFEEIKAYRQILRDLPAQEGTPFDGGGDLTPWPHMPEV